jgi:hypothetical protein
MKSGQSALSDRSLWGTLKIAARGLRKKFFTFNWEWSRSDETNVIYLKDNNKQGQLRNGEVCTLYRRLGKSISACKGELIDNVLAFSAMKRVTSV